MFTPMAEKTKQKDAEYGADSIQRLEGLEAVRKRPGMYIGQVDKTGAHHLAWEVVDNSVDEALAGHCTEILVEVSEDNFISVSDDGRGIPTGVHKQTGEPAFMMVFEDLHAGGKFDEGAYKVSAGLHGVGASVTNALSDRLEVTIHQGGYEWTAAWEKGKRAAEPKKGRKVTGTGTTVRWHYDPEIFKTVKRIDPEIIERGLMHRAYLMKGLRFRFRAPGQPEKVITSKHGLREFVENHAEEFEPIHAPALHFETEGITVDRDGEQTQIAVEVALQWVAGHDRGQMHSFANIVNTKDGGTHVAGLGRAVVRAMNELAFAEKKLNPDKKGDRLENRDIFGCCVAAVSVKLGEVAFKNQTKDALLNPEAASAVYAFMNETFTAWLKSDKNAKEVKAILERVLFARRARINAGKAQKNFNPNSIFSDSGQSAKLMDADPQSKPEDRELFIVEGDSAGGTAKSARNRFNQAILPLRGKPINAIEKMAEERRDAAKQAKAEEAFFGNAEVRAIITAMGGRIDEFEGRLMVSMPREKWRYHKVVIAADADADGAHIRALILAIYHVICPQMILEGRVFMARPPLFKIDLDPRGEKYVYAWSPEERTALMKQHRVADAKRSVSRFKGLGEMMAEDLRATTFDPETRQLQQVTVEDAAEMARAFHLILGGKAALRKEWLESGRAREALERALGEAA